MEQKQQIIVKMFIHTHARVHVFIHTHARVVLQILDYLERYMFDAKSVRLIDGQTNVFHSIVTK